MSFLARVSWLAVVLFPMLILLRHGELLLVGLLVSVVLATLSIRRRGERWHTRGLQRPERPARLFLAVGVATVAMLLLTGPLQALTSAITGVGPDLEAFAILQGNLPALLGGLVVVWTVAAFGEEMLFRGYLLNEFVELLPERMRVSSRWIVSFLLTSLLVGLGHSYQGSTGMIMTAVLAVGFGLVYLAAGRNLWAPILTHGLYDTVGFVLVYAGLTDLG